MLLQRLRSRSLSCCRQSTYCVIAAVVVPVLACAGCVVHGGGDDTPRFSRDNSLAVWVRYDYLTVLPDFENPVCRSVTVKWCRAASPDVIHAAWLLREQARLLIAPDSRHLAVIAPDMLRIIATADARSHELLPRGETVTSVAWLADDEVAYASHTHQRGPYRDLTDRSFWRQRIDAPPGERTLIRREEGVRAGFSARGRPDWPEYWSPRGSYVVYQPSRFARLNLLDLKRGTAQEFGPADVWLEDVAWRDDESAACIMRRDGLGHPYCALQIDSRTFRVTDFSSEFITVIEPRVVLSIAWTGDGRYLIYNDSFAGRWLIQPEPFRAVHLTERVPVQLDRGVVSDYAARLEPLAFPGWVRARGPGRTSAEDDAEREGYLIDYEGRRRIGVGPVGAAWSLDGRLAANIGRDGRLKVRHIELPELPPE
ncbi:MAG: hypothetical protein AB1716_16865 [Planctomycetota bacterium]